MRTGSETPNPKDSTSIRTSRKALKTLSRGSVLHPTLPVDRVTRRKFRMAQDSDDPLFVVNIVVWVLVIILVIVALH